MVALLSRKKSREPGIAETSRHPNGHDEHKEDPTMASSLPDNAISGSIAQSGSADAARQAVAAQIALAAAGFSDRAAVVDAVPAEHSSATALRSAHPQLSLETPKLNDPRPNNTERLSMPEWLPMSPETTSQETKLPVVPASPPQSNAILAPPELHVIAPTPISPSAAASTSKAATAGPDTLLHVGENPALAHGNEPSSGVWTHEAGSAAATNDTPSRPSATAEKPAKPRGGWKLFSSKRGLDKAGNPTFHRHSHISKAFCMHKGAVEPPASSRLGAQKAKKPADTSSKEKAAPAEKVAQPLSASPDSTSSPQATEDAKERDHLPAEPSKGRVKIADDANPSRDYNIPLATNATFGTDAYQTALEAPYPTSGTAGGIDYFAGNVTHRQVPANNHEDQAKLVSRQSQLDHHIRDDRQDEEDLTLAFSVKKAANNPEPALAYKVKQPPQA